MPPRRVNPDNLINAREVARILGLSRATAVAVYRRRYDDFPEPVVRKGQCTLWVRADIIAWYRSRRD